MSLTESQGTIGRKLHGGTTIAGTMILARLAGIRVFGTGGLGGVHRGWERHMDISADLTELGRTPVAVISSGCKSFLDIPRTIEYLETQGVGVGTFADGRKGIVPEGSLFLATILPNVCGIAKQIPNCVFRSAQDEGTKTSLLNL